MKNSARLALCALACLIFGCVSVEAQTISTVVGGGPSGLNPTASSVGSPVAVRFDTSGNMYVLDNLFGRVLKVDHTTGLISVYAGNGTVGFSGDNGPAGSAVNAQMNGPSGMCIDANNNLFIADSDNAVIREVLASDQTIHTVVGVQTSTNPTYGGDGGVATSAHLHFPDGCAFDSKGNMYIADRGNNEVRVVIGPNNRPPFGFTGTTANFIYRFAGGTNGAGTTPPTGGYAPDGSIASSAQIYGPFDVVVDASDNVYVADLGNNFDANGVPDTQPGQPPNNNVVREILAVDGTIHTVAGAVTTIAGVPTGQYGSVATGPAVGTAVNQPKGLSIDTSGNLYFCDAVNQAIRKVSGGNISVVAGTIGSRGFSGDGGLATSATLTFPAGSFIDSTGVLYIADVGSNATRVVPLLANAGAHLLDHIYSVAGNGKVSYGGDSAAATDGELNTPAGLWVDVANNIIVADAGSDVIREVGGVSGKLSTIAGQPEANGFLNNPSTINGALSVATDPSGNAYVADTANCIIRKIATSGGITTFAGVEPPIVSTDNAILNVPVCGFAAAGGAAVGTKLGFVNSVAIDFQGNVFFSDKTNNVIWEVPKTTTGSLVAGNAYIVAGVQSTTGAFAGDGGPANAAKLNGPTGIYIDAFNNLFVADAGNHRIREVPATTGGTMTAGSIYTIAGTGTSGNTGDNAAATAATLATPFAIVVDTAGNVFFSDTTNQTVREIAGSNAGGLTVGDIYTVAGTKNVAGFSGDGGVATSAELNGPQGLALQPNASPSTTANLLVSDSGNNRVRSVANIASNAVALASLSPNPLTFPSGTVGTASAAMAVTLTNGGGATLSVTSVGISGTNASDFSKTENCTAPGTVAPGGTCTINVVFTPTASGARTATLTVTDTAAGGSQTVTLNGTATDAALSLTVKDTDSSPTQTVTAGATATYNLSVSGNQSVTATITCSGAPTAATCTPTPASVAVTAAAPGTFKVSVTTTARGEMLPFNQPSVKMQPPSFLQIAPMASLALLFLIVTILGSMQNQPGRMRLARVALSLCLILMPIAAATVLVGCGGGSSTTPPPPATGTPAGTYTITVTATSGSTSSTPLNLTLIVN